MKTQPKSSSKRYFHQVLAKFGVYPLILLTALAVFFIFILLNAYYQLKIIQIEGPVKKNEINGLESLKGVNMLFLSDTYVIDTINNSNPTILVENLTKEYPNKILLKLKSLDPLAQLKLNSGLALLSEQGKILKKVKVKDNRFPIINFYQQFDYYQLSTGEILDYEELTTALFLLNICRELDLKVESIDISGLSMIVFNLKDPPAGEAGKKILFSAEKDRGKQASELETLLIQFKIKAQEFKVIDLRFDKPVVKF